MSTSMPDVGGGTAEGGAFVTTLSAKLQEKAEMELNEKAKWRDRDIQALRDMVLAHKGLKACTRSDFLLRFLRARKFDYDRAYTLLINYYTIRAANTEVFKAMLPSNEEVTKVFAARVVSVLPRKDAEGRSIFYLRPGKWNPEDYSIFNILRANILSLELCITDEDAQVSGVVIIINLADTGFQHLRNMDRNYARIMTSVMQDAFPMRVKGINFVNESSIFGAVFAIVKPFLKEKTVKRLTFHGSSLASLHKQFDPSILPTELGGHLAPGDQLAQEWSERVVSHESMYVDMARYSIEIPRGSIVHGGGGTPGGGLGSSVDATADCLVGSYRKLNVD